MTLDRRSLTQMLASAGLGALVPPNLAQAQALAAVAPENEDSTRVAATRDKSTRLMAPVRINGKGPYAFLVDTGANKSCVSRELADRLNLPAGAEVSLHTMVAARTRSTIKVERLEVGTRSQRNVEIPVLPMTYPEADGVLGVDWLKAQRLVLDFKGRSLEIAAPKYESSTPNRVVVPARKRSGQLTLVDADMNGAPISAMIDSGSEISIGNNSLRRLLSRENSGREHVERVELSSLVGEKFVGDLGYLPFMRLGGLNLGNVPVVFSESHVFALWELQSRPTIILGMDLLTQFNAVALDFGRSTVRFDVA